MKRDKQIKGVGLGHKEEILDSKEAIKFSMANVPMCAHIYLVFELLIWFLRFFQIEYILGSLLLSLSTICSSDEVQCPRMDRQEYQRSKKAQNFFRPNYQIKH